MTNALTEGTPAEEKVEAKEGPEDEVEMTFLEHIRELRTRLIRAIIGVLPCIVVAYFFSEEIMDILLAPLVEAYRALGLETQIHFKNLVDPFMAYLKVSIIAGILGAAPWIFWQVWGFLSPGLYRREKLYALPFVLASSLCFAGGAVFGYLIVFPMGFETFLEFAGPLPSGDIVMTPTIMIDEYISFAMQMLLAFGAVFEVPVIVTFLSILGLVSWKGLLEFGRWWVALASILAAAFTPPDVVSQLIMLVPLVALYFVGVAFAFVIEKRRARAEKKSA